MNPARFLEHFDRISEAPNAVPRLRRFVLDLAVRGKLVEQDQADEPSSRLIQKILESQRLTTEELALGTDGQPFSLPGSWSWIRIGQAAYIEMGQSPPSDRYNQSRQGMPFYQGKADFGSRHPTPRYWCSQPTKVARTGDILISVRAPVGPTNVASEDCCIGRGLAALRPHPGVDREFLLRCLQSFELALASLGFGTTFVAINKAHLVSFPIPLPPLAEQRRIVGRVDELMALCDRLEEAQVDRESRRDRLAAASLARLNQPSDDASFREGARFDLDQLSRVTIRPDQIRPLRQSLLDLAVQGQLAPQDPDDKPASELLERIHEQKDLAAGSQPARKSRKPPPTNEGADDRPKVPKGWCWATLGDVALSLRYGTSVKCSYERIGHPVLRIPNIDRGRVTLEDLKFGNLASREVEQLRLEVGDILMVRSNGSLDLVGRPALVDVESAGYCYAGYLIRVRLATQYCAPRYLMLALSCTDVRDQIEIPIRTTVGLKNVNATELNGLAFRFPPLAEQNRIVAKVDELMALCDRLETQVATARAESCRLLDALLDEASA